MSFQQVLKNQKQISNTYLPHNGLLSYSDYGNGGRVGYTYDKWERMVENLGTLYERIEAGKNEANR